MKEVKRSIDIVTEGLTRAFEQGNERVVIPGFGEFYAKYRNPRKGRNASTGEIFTIPAKTVIRYKPGKFIEDAVDAGFNDPSKRGANLG